MKRFLMWLTAKLPVRIISNDESVPYLERYFLFSVFGITGYLHRFVGSDPDRGLHDHPWRWAVSFVLKGFYTELVINGVRTIKWFNFLRGTDFHRVLLPDGHAEAWTLFIHQEKRVKSWGFLKDNTVEEFKYEQPPTKWWTRVPVGAEEPKRMK